MFALLPSSGAPTVSEKVVSWVPMDAVCGALLDVGFSTKPAPMAVNVVHPKPISWTFVLQSIQNTLIREKHLSSDALPLVPYHDWVATVEQYANNATTDSQMIVSSTLIISMQFEFYFL